MSINDARPAGTGFAALVPGVKVPPKESTMSAMTKEMSEAGSGRPMTEGATADRPKKGDRYRCRKCGMEIQVTADCGCKDPNHLHFHCCGQELQKA
jgi:hypothetical protein